MAKLKIKNQMNNLKELKEINKKINELQEIRGELEFDCYVCGEKHKYKKMKSIGGKFLCNKCNHFRCKKCGILLRNNCKCERCGIKHGSYSEKSLPFCLDCKRKEDKKKKDGTL